MKAAVLTVSDRVSRGEAEDGSGDTLEELLRADGYDVERRLVPDEADQIAAAIVDLAGDAALVLTTGGTGLAARDAIRHGEHGDLHTAPPSCSGSFVFSTSVTSVMTMPLSIAFAMS